MKVVQVLDGKIVGRAVSVLEALQTLHVTLPKNATEAQKLQVLKAKGWREVHPNANPVIPQELMGKCIVSLGVPVFGDDDTIVRTFEYREAAPDELKRQDSLVRARRAALLRRHVDSIGFLHWESFAEAQKTRVRTYRQALLDVPAQSGFPMNVNWPKP